MLLVVLSHISVFYYLHVSDRDLAGWTVEEQNILNYLFTGGDDSNNVLHNNMTCTLVNIYYAVCSQISGLTLVSVL